MKVLLQGRSAKSLASTAGGDQTLLEETASALRSIGVDADVSAELEPNLNGYDLVHLFGLVRPQEVWMQARNAHRRGVPIALSTVYCDVWDFERRGRGGVVGWIARHTNRNVIEALKAGGRALVSREWSTGSARLFRRGFVAMQKDVLTMTAVFLPNSDSEWKRVAADFAIRIPGDRVVVTPSGPGRGPSSNETSGRTFDQFSGCVACVARIEGRKNQLTLIEAVAGQPYRVVLAGKEAANQKNYVARVRAAAQAAGNVHLVGPVTEAEKWRLYEAARVHILPSWMETIGLSSLEAATQNCAIVVSPNGDTRDYFEDDAAYCDPSSPSSIRAGIEQALAQGPSDALRRRIATQFTWARAAERTLVAYERALRVPGRGSASLRA